MTSLRLVAFVDLTGSELDTWRTLRASSPLLDSPYFDPAFAAAVQASGADVTVAVDGSRAELTRLLACHRDGSVLRPVGWPGADFQGPVLSPGTGFDPRELLVEGVRAFEFDHWLLPFPEVDPWVETRAASPYVEVAGGVEGYLSRASKSGRDNIGQARRRTARAERELGPVTFCAQSTDAEALAWLVDRKREQYAATGARDYFADPARRSLLSLLLDTHDPGLRGGPVHLALRRNARGGALRHPVPAGAALVVPRLRPGVRELRAWLDHAAGAGDGRTRSRPGADRPWPGRRRVQAAGSHRRSRGGRGRCRGQRGATGRPQDAADPRQRREGLILRPPAPTGRARAAPTSGNDWSALSRGPIPNLGQAYRCPAGDVWTRPSVMLARA